MQVRFLPGPPIQVLVCQRCESLQTCTSLRAAGHYARVKGEPENETPRNSFDNIGCDRFDGCICGRSSDPGGFVKTSTAVFAWATPNTTIKANTDTQVGKDRALTCGAKGGCAIFLQAAIEIRPGADDMSWSICARVDGHVANPVGCFGTASAFQDVTTELVYHGTAQVAKGKHTIQFFVFAQNKSQLSTWHEASQMLQ